MTPMKILSLEQQQSVSAGIAEACVFVTEERKEDDNQSDGYMG